MASATDETGLAIPAGPMRLTS